MAGKLITFEGIDNSGKTTVAHELISVLRARSLEVAFAGERSTQVGPLLKNLSQFSPHVKTLLFAADRALLMENAKESLESGAHVVFDRYYHSAIAYRSAEGFDVDYVRSVNRVFRPPDIPILLDIDADVSKQREPPTKPPTPYDRETLARARETYLKLVETDGLLLIDAHRPLDAVVESVVELVVRKLGAS
jgi:dTMP kinase